MPKPHDGAHFSLYVISESDKGPVKLGFAEHPSKRLRELQTGNPRRLHLAFTLEHDKATAIEAWLQRHLRHCRLIGEWYDLEVATAIAAIEEGQALASRGALLHLARSPNLRERNGEVERLCVRCRIWKPQTVENYHTASKRKSGFQGRCRPCSREVGIERLNTKEGRLRHNAAERARKRRLRSARQESLAFGATIARTA